MDLAKLIGLVAFMLSFNVHADFGSEIEKCLVKKKKSDLEYCINMMKAERAKALEERYHFAVVGARKHGSPKRKNALRTDLTNEIEVMNMFITYLTERRELTVNYRKKAHAIRVAAKK